MELEKIVTVKLKRTKMTKWKTRSLYLFLVLFNILIASQGHLTTISYCRYFRTVSTFYAWTCASLFLSMYACFACISVYTYAMH